MQNRDDLDGIPAYPIDEAVRNLDKLTDLGTLELWDHATRLRKPLRLSQSMHNSINNLFRIDRRARGDMLRDRTELGNGLLRPAEPPGHDARRIRARTRANASS